MYSTSAWMDQHRRITRNSITPQTNFRSPASIEVIKIVKLGSSVKAIENPGPIKKICIKSSVNRTLFPGGIGVGAHPTNIIDEDKLYDDSMI